MQPVIRSVQGDEVSGGVFVDGEAVEPQRQVERSPTRRYHREGGGQLANEIAMPVTPNTR